LWTNKEENLPVVEEILKVGILPSGTPYQSIGYEANFPRSINNLRKSPAVYAALV
jgi:hypothetical protein